MSRLPTTRSFKPRTQFYLALALVYPTMLFISGMPARSAWDPTVTAHPDHVHAGDTVTITGSDFAPEAELAVDVTDPDGGTAFSADVVADSGGAFEVGYVFAGGLAGTYAVDVLDLDGAVLASTTFDGGTHNRYGHVSWSAGPGNQINFVSENAWRRNQGTCRDPNSPNTIIPCTGPGGLAGVGDIHSQGVSNPVFHFGDGSTFSFPGGVLHLVTAIDPVNNWYFGEVIDHTQLPTIATTFSHTYAAPGNYTAFLPDCCRISGSAFPNRHINNPDASIRIETLVSVNTGDSSAQSLLPPIVLCPIDDVCTFSVPVVDPDGDPLRWRLSTSAEMGGGSNNQPGPPQAPNAASIDPDTGVYTWDTTGASLGGVDPTVWNVLYSTQVTIESLDADHNVKSKVAVDFFIRLVPTVGEPPVFDPPTPECGTTLPAFVGSTLVFTVQASDSDPGDVVTLNVLGLPPGATMDPSLPTSGNPVSSDFSWMPTAAQVGPHLVTFTATDQTFQSAICTFTIVVEEEPPFVDGFMTGGGSVFTAEGVRVTHGFRLACDAASHPNKMQVNWGQGQDSHRFHLEEVTSALCTDDPDIDQSPPEASFDTHTGGGLGRYNGVGGATVEWMFTDEGRDNNDHATIQIWDAEGNLVLTVSGPLNNGRHQAHD